MTGFLERIAYYLYEQSGGDLRRHCVVFPSRRAGIYFLRYLAEIIKKPVWAPPVMTINEFFESESELNIAETEILMFELYKVYGRINKLAESFDDFYFWGEMLINDFDDLDKYLADASVLFRNVQDLKNIDLQFGDVNSETAKIIKRFWKNFEPEKPSPAKSEFKNIWSILGELYFEFKKALYKENLAYEGMIFRDVAETARQNGQFGSKYDKVHFIGFNALNKCEKAIMGLLQARGKACFYWDYDNSYTGGGRMNSAGLFMQGNLRMFGNDMPDNWNYNALLSSAAQENYVEIVETTSDVAQVKLVPELIGKIQGFSHEKAIHTAVILTDETLLVPLLTSLPENIGDINISMGYPLKMTGVYTLIKYFLNLQKNAITENDVTYFSSRDVIDILQHQLIEPSLNETETSILNEVKATQLNRIPSGYLHKTDNLMKIFRVDADAFRLSDHLRELLLSVSIQKGYSDEEDQHADNGKNLLNEYLYRVLLSINRLDRIAKSSDLTFNTQTYLRILDKILSTQSVPFSGEPLSGIQIMGILETRSLDFENIIMLSVNEGILPAATAGSSFIPFNIREAFGLPTINHQESIFAYHFYRLLQRAKKVMLVYNSNSEGLRTGEVSRFVTQMKYEQILRQEYMNLNFNIKSTAVIGPLITRTKRHSDRLISIFNAREGKSMLSPSAINTWLNCRMKFYYRYVNGLRETEKVRGIADYAMLGDLLHRLMKNIYEKYQGTNVNKEHFNSLINSEVYLLNLIDKTFHEKDNPEIEKVPDGNELIIKDILLLYLKRILKADRAVSPFRIISLEKPYGFEVTCKAGNKNIAVRTGGTVDRIDIKNDNYRIVDYKTGEVARSISSTDDLFREDRKPDSDGWLQTLLYCEAFLIKTGDIRLKPSIYRIRELSDQNLTDTLKIKTGKNQEFLLEDYTEIRNQFLDGLSRTIEVIFNDGEDFRMTDDLQKCNYCPYRALCQR